MRWVLLLLGLVVGRSEAHRRLSPYDCQAQAFIVAEGAPTLRRGRAFSDTYGTYEDARVDSTGRGTALLAQVPECLRAEVIPIKVVGARLGDAVEWINAQCMARDCVVFSAYAHLQGRFKLA